MNDEHGATNKPKLLGSVGESSVPSTCFNSCMEIAPCQAHMTGTGEERADVKDNQEREAFNEQPWDQSWVGKEAGV